MKINSVRQSITIMTEDTELGDESNGELLHLQGEQAARWDLGIHDSSHPKKTDHSLQKKVKMSWSSLFLQNLSIREVTLHPQREAQNHTN